MHTYFLIQQDKKIEKLQWKGLQVVAVLVVHTL